jgi:hypothetical protein
MLIRSICMVFDQYMRAEKETVRYSRTILNAGFRGLGFGRRIARCIAADTARSAALRCRRRPAAQAPKPAGAATQSVDPAGAATHSIRPAAIEAQPLTHLRDGQVQGAVCA